MLRRATVLDAIGDTPARVWSEGPYESDRHLPVRSKPHLAAAGEPRQTDMRRGARDDLPGWRLRLVACDGHTTRSIVKTLRHTHGLAKVAVEYQVYRK